MSDNSAIPNPQFAIRNPQSLDQLGKKIPLPQGPLRIVSLVPSQTELLYYLGLEEEVVGITKFCVHPESWYRSKTRVGGTKNPHIDLIRALRPNLVIANKEENNLEDILSIETFCPVWTSDIHTIPDALDMINTIGEITRTTDKAVDLTATIKREFSLLKIVPAYRCAYLIWKDPWMAAGGDTFINDMLEACGLINILKQEKRYPVADLDQLLARELQVLFLSSEPYPFKTKDLDELTKILPDVKVMLVDGEIFSWYGSRMLNAPGYFRKLREALEGK